MSDMEKPKYIEKNPIQCYFSTINPTWSGPGLYNKRPVTHCPSHFMTWKQCKSFYMSCQRRRCNSSGDVAALIVKPGTRRT
jgi:hypothetical protein